MSLVVILGFDVALFVRLFMAFQIDRESFLRRLNLESNMSLLFEIFVFPRFK